MRYFSDVSDSLRAHSMKGRHRRIEFMKDLLRNHRKIKKKKLLALCADTLGVKRTVAEDYLEIIIDEELAKDTGEWIIWKGP